MDEQSTQQNDGLEGKNAWIEEKSVSVVEEESEEVEDFESEEEEEEESVIQNNTGSEERVVIQEKSSPSVETRFIQKEEKTVTEESAIENLIHSFQGIAVAKPQNPQHNF